MALTSQELIISNSNLSYILEQYDFKYKIILYQEVKNINLLLGSKSFEYKFYLCKSIYRLQNQ